MTLRARDRLAGLLRLWLAAVLAVAALALATPAAAQLTEEQQAFLDDWLATADRAEEAVANGRASNVALEHLRAEVAEFRETFESAQTQNSARLQTLQSQLEALGPAPGEGETEPDEIARLRGELRTRIQNLRVPVIVSSEAYSRADGIIQEIDRIIRDRQRQELLSRSDTPLDPQLWPVAVRALTDALDAIGAEARVNWSNPTEVKKLRQNLPQSVLLLVVGLLFLFLGRRWAEKAGAYMRNLGGVGSGIWGFVISLGRIALPLIGVYVIVQAVAASGVLGLRGELILNATPYWAAVLLGFRWMSERLYPQDDEDVFGNLPENRGAARRNLVSLGIVLVLFDITELFEQIENVSAGVSGVIKFPVIVLGAVLLYRLRQVVAKDRNARTQDPDEHAPRTGLTWIGPLFRWSSGLVAIAAPLVAAAGYGALAEAILFPFIKTVALYGALLVLQAFFRDIYAWLTGKSREAAEDSIVPILIGFALVIGSLPVLVLIWGAREADLTEIWDRFLEGMKIGNSTITPVDLLMFLVVFAVGFALTRVFQAALKTSLLPRTKLDQGGRNAVVSGTGYVGIFLAGLIAVSTAGIDLSSLAIVAGALSVGIGFGLQNIVSNFVSGIILLIERPVAEGDWIEVGGNMGYVRDISVRSTRIETFDRSDVIVPNSELVSGTVTNYTRGNTVGRLIVPVGVAYGTDTRLVESILQDVAEAHPMVLANPPPSVLFREFGADSLNFEIRAILRDVNWVLSVQSEMNHEINARFREAGVEIPFAQRDIWLRNPEALRGETPRAPGPDDTPRPPGSPARAREVPPELQDAPEPEGQANDD